MSQALPYVGTPESLTRAWLDVQEILGFNGPVTSRNERIHSQKHTEMAFHCSTPARFVSAASTPEVAAQHTDPFAASPLLNKQRTAPWVNALPLADGLLRHVSLFLSLFLFL